MTIQETYRNNSSCFLDGQPAKIVGFLENFATITTGHRSFQWSWEAVDRIMKKDKKFTT